ncbi:PREDICTED: beta-galactosidase-1-like protein 2 [Branchiostoma belcheri]|uniref:Beta-galactosidase-1-like protein 2 n=1 Tax=Branchiostoma belcheri TaxID=7741 RepID=A0A6P5AQJ4_BRABE|nr:PREDICTED: beta-galactosidase-1-like protein 2 [Branchiostoma belcheri]
MATEGTERTGLVAEGENFTLDGKPVQLLSGAIHYFRVPREYWRDRMLKLKACGLNTLETWLLRDPNMRVRTTYQPYMEAVERFFDALLPIIKPFQYKEGGPIIAVQVENEYGSYARDDKYLTAVKQAIQNRGIEELLLTSDGGDIGRLERGCIPGVLMTANFNFNPKKQLGALKKIQPNRPMMVMEFWSGWFDHWGRDHHKLHVEKFEQLLGDILRLRSSVNFYMFHGGTNFGFMNGANYINGYKPDVTSYDYDAPLSEAGDPTPKYHKTRELLQTLAMEGAVPSELPDVPPATEKSSYGPFPVEKYITFEDALKVLGEPIRSEKVMSMEMLPINNDNGQSYGYILYRHKLTHTPATESVTLKCDVRDRAQIFVNGKESGMLNWRVGEITLSGFKENDILDILVENQGRVNFAQTMDGVKKFLLESVTGVNRGDALLDQRKGLVGEVLLNTDPLETWEIFPLELKPEFQTRLVESPDWKELTDAAEIPFPSFHLINFSIPEDPKDTFLDMKKGWGKGVAILNGFNLGRYWHIGPQETLYVPAPFLKQGDNQLLLFEQHVPYKEVFFTDTPRLGKEKEVSCVPL